MGINSAVPHRKAPTDNDTPKKPQTVLLAETVERATPVESEQLSARVQPRNGSAKTMRTRHSGNNGNSGGNGSTHRDAKLNVRYQEQLETRIDDDRDTSWASFAQGNRGYGGRDI